MGRGGGFYEGQLGVGGPGGAIFWGGSMPPRLSVVQSQAPLTSPCPPSNHTITLNLTATFAASRSSHASHVDSVGGQSGQHFPSCACGAYRASDAFGAYGLLREAPLATNCWPEAPSGGGGGELVS